MSALDGIHCVGARYHLPAAVRRAAPIVVSIVAMLSARIRGIDHPVNRDVPGER